MESWLNRCVQVLSTAAAVAEPAVVPRVGARRALLFRVNRQPLHRDGHPVRAEDGCDERLRAVAGFRLHPSQC